MKFSVRIQFLIIIVDHTFEYDITANEHNSESVRIPILRIVVALRHYPSWAVPDDGHGGLSRGAGGCEGGANRRTALEKARLGWERCADATRSLGGFV